jgi:putative glutamine amidotransferase
MKKTLPLIGIMADFREEDRGWIRSPSQYMEPIERICLAVPVYIPPLESPDRVKINALLDRLDGVMLSGSPSNINPEHYGQTWQTPELPQDRVRDATSLSLVPTIIQRRIPLLGICRGFQEINVALGGTLYQKVHEEPSFHDHRAPPGKSTSEQFSALQHSVTVINQGVLQQITKTDTFWVNSLHGQGIKTLAPKLTIEAVADDHLVEAFTLRDHPFLLAVQWHPEWEAEKNEHSLAIFRAFADACRQYQLSKH